MRTEELKKSITLVYPCDTDPDKIIAEVDLAINFDAEKVCKILENSDLKDVKCSVGLGLAKFEIEEKKITVFKNGRLIIKEANDEQDVTETIAKIKELLASAVKQ